MRFSTLDQWLNWQETLHPNEIELGLERVSGVLGRLHANQPGFTAVTVAGTNGKGSSVAMLEAILLAAGYRVGAYSSPHLLRYNERIRINGAEVDDQTLCAAFECVDQARGETSLTYFEFGTLAAIDIFQQAEIDIAILEVGLGGRLDAVNMLDADVALITAIDLDHQDWLGDDRESIGREKAGILRAGRPAVCTDSHPPASLLAHAQQLEAPLALLGRDFFAEVGSNDWRWRGQDGLELVLPLPALVGEVQCANAAGVLMVLQTLGADFPLDVAAIREGLVSVCLAGRFQQIPGPPLQIFDVAHNPQSARALAQNLAAQACQGRTRLVLAMLADKDVASVVESLRHVIDDWYLAPLAVTRGASSEQLQNAVQSADQSTKQGAKTKSYASVSEALRAAQQDATEQDRIVVAGSFYTVAVAQVQAV